MRKNHSRLSKRIFKIIWSGILLVSLYLIFSFAALSFSGNVGQADAKLTDTIFSGLCKKVMEEGAALIGYSAREEQGDFPIAFLDARLALQNYAGDSAVWTARAEANTTQSSGIVSADAAVEVMNTKDVVNQLGYYEISEQYISKEYILTNGAVYDSLMAGDVSLTDQTDQLQVDSEEGEVYYEDENAADDSQTVSADGAVKYTLDQLRDTSFLVSKFYIVDSSTKITNSLFDADKLMGADMTIKQENDKPQILIYHTHSQEAFIDSRANHPEDTVVGVGTYLAEILEEDYGYNVIHDKTTYDIVDGKLNRNVAYTKAEDGLDKILGENPTIEVVIDLHRDDGAARNVMIDGKETARVMLFNGLSRDQNGPITYLNNPNLQDNLAFSFQLQLKSYELYPGLFCKNYLKSYRYNLHVRPKSLLVELGTDENTLESAKNAMVPFAKILDTVLKGE